jgi:hypothetical protein
MSVRANHSHQSTIDLRFARNVIIKALVLFLLLNGLFAWIKPAPFLGRLSAYNHLFPGRKRLPYGDEPQQSYNLSLFNLEAMFASHEISAGPKPANEYRVLVIGDSATWGFLLKPDQTLTANINKAGYTLEDGRQVRAYNLGYPVMSLTKDLVILSKAVQYQPDLIVWPVTLESFPYDKQLYPPLLQHNPEVVRSLIQQYQLNLDAQDPNLITSSFWDNTLIGQRRNLADLLRLQFYGVMWAATGIDQDIPETYTPRMEDMPADESFHDLKLPHLTPKDLAFDILQAGITLAGRTPVILINEPMFISQGQNSDIRYNFYYPRWAYDDYRQLMVQETQTKGWHYLDEWNSISSSEFTNSAVHLSPNGSSQFAAQVGKAVLKLANGNP